MVRSLYERRRNPCKHQRVRCLATLQPTDRKKRVNVQHVILVDRKKVKLLSGKEVWPSRGAARSALVYHIDLLGSQIYGVAGSFKDAALSLTKPRYGTVRDLKYKAKDVVAALLTTGRVEIVPLIEWLNQQE